jgi:hypothetical protein
VAIRDFSHEAREEEKKIFLSKVSWWWIYFSVNAIY